VAVQDLGLACCTLEVEAAVQAGFLRVDDDDSAPAQTVILISGTVTEALAPAIERAIGAVLGRVAVLSVGACANTGGPYWDADTVVKGVDSLVPVARYVPGCPPRPEALVAAIAAQAERP
jgi:NADH-quinone oxidoreductase subunit B